MLPVEEFLVEHTTFGSSGKTGERVHDLEEEIVVIPAANRRWEGMSKWTVTITSGARRVRKTTATDDPTEAVREALKEWGLTSDYSTFTATVEMIREE